MLIIHEDLDFLIELDDNKILINQVVHIEGITAIEIDIIITGII